MKKRGIVAGIALLLCLGLSFGSCSLSAGQDEKTEDTEVVEEKADVTEAEVLTETPTATETPTVTEPQTPTPELTEDPADGRLAMGEKDEAAWRVTLINQTDINITAVQIRWTADSDYSENLLPDGEMFEYREIGYLYLHVDELAPYTDHFLTADADDAASVLKKAGMTASDCQIYSIKLTFPDGYTTELHNFIYGEIAEADIHWTGDVAYITYENLSDKSEVSTQANEEALWADSEDAEDDEVIAEDNTEYAEEYEEDDGGEVTIVDSDDDGTETSEDGEVIGE